MDDRKNDITEHVMRGELLPNMSHSETREALLATTSILQVIRQGQISLMGQTSEQQDAYLKSNALKVLRSLAMCKYPDVEERARKLIDDIEGNRSTSSRSISSMRLNINPYVFLFPLIIVLSLCAFFMPAQRNIMLFILVFALVPILLDGIMRLFDLVNPPPMPRSAVSHLLNLCIEGQDLEEWAVVNFKPNKSLQDVRRELGNQNYSHQDRVDGFMRKFDMVAPQRQTVAIFYSSQKGIAVAKVGPIKAIVKKTGKWKVNTWRSLAGALTLRGMDVQSLDGPQTFFT